MVLVFSWKKESKIGSVNIQCCIASVTDCVTSVLTSVKSVLN